MEVSQLQAWADDAERKMVGVPKEIAAARTTALAEYQSSAEFEQVRTKNFDKGVRMFIYNVWCEHPEWDMSFLGDAAKKMIAEFDAPLETPIVDPPAEFVPPTDQSPEVANRLPQVINEDFPVVKVGGSDGADEDDEVMQIDNPAGVLSSDCCFSFL